MEQIIAKLKERCPELDSQGLRAIATDLYYSGEWETVLASEQTVDKLLKSYHTKLTEGSAHKVAANDPTRCPICKVPLKPVKLNESKEAVWCNKHFVVFPVKKAK